MLVVVFVFVFASYLTLSLLCISIPNTFPFFFFLLYFLFLSSGSDLSLSLSLSLSFFLSRQLPDSSRGYYRLKFSSIPEDHFCSILSFLSLSFFLCFFVRFGGLVKKFKARVTKAILKSFVFKLSGGYEVGFYQIGEGWAVGRLSRLCGFCELFFFFFFLHAIWVFYFIFLFYYYCNSFGSFFVWMFVGWSFHVIKPKESGRLWLWVFSAGYGTVWIWS